MYSGSDSTDAQNYTQWALNPSTYQNMSNDQVDWAALAQQWIIMKEAGPPVPEQITNAPPPTVNKPPKKEVTVEGGEAPMEVENDAEDVQPQWNDGGGSGDSWSWNQQQTQPPPPQQQQPQQQQQQQQQSWGWGNSWSSPLGVPPPNSVKTPLLPTPPAYNQYSSNDNCNDNSNYGAAAAADSITRIPCRNSPEDVFKDGRIKKISMIPAWKSRNTEIGYTSVPSSDYQGGYWTSAAGSSKVIKPHNKRYSKVNVPTAVAPTKPVTIDAAKRKQLPAWIREGLEKMERDKLKQLDKERERLEKEEYDAKMKLSEKNALEILKTTVKEQQKSKFESDDSDNDTDGRPLTPDPIPLSQEELMLKVRRTMTEILLKVTNREIYNICREELQRHLKKLKASDQRASAPSGANLSAKLGLGAYGGSGSSSESSDDESSKDHHDSDADLKDTIKRRKAEFVKTEREIEDKLAEAERDGEGSRAVSPDNSDNDSQVDAKISGGKSRLNSYEKTPPMKSSQNSKRKSRRTSSSSDSDSDTERSNRSKDRRLTRDRRSSSTLSSRSDKYKRSRHSRSRTPEQKNMKYGESDRKSRYAESKSSRRSRSKSPVFRRRRSRSPSIKRSSRRDSRYSKRSPTRSRSRSRSSYDRFRNTRSTSRNRRSSSRSYTSRRRRSRSSQRSSAHKHRRSRSHSNGRGKRSHRH